MLDRFSHRARRVIVAAAKEAATLGHPALGTEHLLLALAYPPGVAAAVLSARGVTPERVKSHVIQYTREGAAEGSADANLVLTAEAKRSIEFALREGLSFRHQRVVPEHMLLGLLRLQDAVAAHILRDFGADLAQVRNDVITAYLP
jgi:ATP-dependent Clp protease ATP-binding subunit ClpC